MILKRKREESKSPLVGKFIKKGEKIVLFKFKNKKQKLYCTYLNRKKLRKNLTIKGYLFLKQSFNNIFVVFQSRLKNKSRNVFSISSGNIGIKGSKKNSFLTARFIGKKVFKAMKKFFRKQLISPRKRKIKIIILSNITNTLKALIRSIYWKKKMIKFQNNKPHNGVRKPHIRRV